MRMMTGVLQKPYVKATWITLLSVYIAYYLGTAMVLEPYRLRMLLAIGLGLIFYAISLIKPNKALIAMFILLPILGFIRRALIPFAGWSGFDPIVAIVPGMVCFFGFNYYYERFFRKQLELDDSKFFSLVRWLLFVHIMQVFNPMQGSLLAGMAGAMFYITPLMWMTLSRQHFSEKMMIRFIKVIPIIACILALYGLKQIYLGFYSFEITWMNMTNYSSLNVQGMMRAISTFTSANEYAQFLSISAVICWAFMLKANSSKLPFLLPLPLLFYAIFMTSQRGAALTTMIAISLLSILSARTRKSRTIVTIVTLLITTGAYIAIININPNDNALIAHQVDGLANPLDDEHSTVGLHWKIIMDGFVRGLTNPLGYGLGTGSIAGAKLGSGVIGTEVDLTNILISDGIIGFVLYFFIIVKGLKSAYRLYKLDNSPLSFAIWGILISTIGGWCIGGNYSTAALIWICIGYMDRAYVKKSRIYQEQAMKE
ncbi:hypothetical protein [Gorillibacterium massiliense]|uniref:hypothetical protein n=1 Tax=Gorillibacterium massiliense TaxID=1280390 RepID=UPI0004B67F0A|nr:hypothetical protein [Gorillibacterium massiliense]